MTPTAPPAQPQGLPKAPTPPRTALLSLLALLLSPRLQGIPEPHRGGCPRSPEFPGVGIRAGSKVEEQLRVRCCMHMAWGGDAPLNPPPKGAPPKPPKPSPSAPELGPLLTPGWAPDTDSAPVWESQPPRLTATLPQWCHIATVVPHCRVPGTALFSLCSPLGILCTASPCHKPERALGAQREGSEFGTRFVAPSDSGPRPRGGQGVTPPRLSSGLTLQRLPPVGPEHSRIPALLYTEPRQPLGCSGEGWRWRWTHKME